MKYFLFIKTQMLTKRLLMAVGILGIYANLGTTKPTHENQTSNNLLIE